MGAKFAVATFQASFLHMTRNVLFEAFVSVKSGWAQGALEISCFCTIMPCFAMVLQCCFGSRSELTISDFTNIRFSQFKFLRVGLFMDFQIRFCLGSEIAAKEHTLPGFQVTME